MCPLDIDLHRADPIIKRKNSTGYYYFHHSIDDMPPHTAGRQGIPGPGDVETAIPLSDAIRTNLRAKRSAMHSQYLKFNTWDLLRFVGIHC